MAFLAIEIEATMDVYGFLLFPVLFDMCDVSLLILFFHHLLNFVVIEYIIIEDFHDVFEATVRQSKEQ